MRRMWIFCRKIYDPGVHLYFAMNWALSFAIYLMFSHSLKLSVSWHHLIPVATLFLMLFILRIVDEIKDYDYDKVYNLDRPLVKGEVEHSFLWRWVALLAIISISLNIASSFIVLLILLLDIVYSIFLITLEKKSSLVKNQMIVNLLFTYPVNLALSFYLLFYYQSIYQLKIIPQDYLMIAAFALNFLYYEFARKIGPESLNQKGEKLYSEVLGMKGSIFVTVSFSLLTVTALMFIYQSAIPVFLMIAPVLGLLTLRRKSIKRPMMLSGSLFLGLFYACVFVLSYRGL